MAMAFAIEDRSVDADTHVVAVAGEIDLFTAPEFKQRVSAPIDEGRTHVIVDLTETTFIDSSSLGVLIGAHRRLRRLEGRLVIVCSNDAIVKTFRITGLDGVFTIVGHAGRGAQRRRGRRVAAHPLGSRWRTATTGGMTEMKTAFAIAHWCCCGRRHRRGYFSRNRRPVKRAANPAKGAAHAVTPRFGHEEMDDQTLADRVRSEIFRARDAPKGGVSVDVQAGVAYLRGESPTRRGSSASATTRARSSGITGVKNLLHAPGTPTPTAEPRSLAAERQTPKGARPLR